MSDIIDHGQKQMDISKWAGGKNILPMGGETEEQDPFCGEVPNDRKGYGQYKNFFEKKMLQAVGDSMTISAHANCEIWDEKGRPLALHSQVDEHRDAGIVVACAHVIYQDEVNPEGVYFRPLSRGFSTGVYLCKTCFKLELNRKLNYNLHLHMKCSKCVGDSIERIAAVHPDRIINLAHAQ